MMLIDHGEEDDGGDDADDDGDDNDDDDDDYNGDNTDADGDNDDYHENGNSLYIKCFFLPISN